MGDDDRSDSGIVVPTADRSIWHDESVAIDFELTGAVSEPVCKLSVTRDELTEDQLDGLYALRLHDARVRAGCDNPGYAITVHAEDGSSRQFLADFVDCVSTPIVLFQDFEAWAQSTPCSWTSH